MFLDWFKKLQQTTKPNTAQTTKPQNTTKKEEKPAPDLTQRSGTTQMNLFEDK